MRFQRQGLRTGISKLQGNFSKTVTKPEKVAISMHCNLRPPDFASVVLRFNYKTHSYQVWSRLAYSFLTENVITVDTLRYAVTLTFDPLTLDVCSVSAVTCWNYLYHVFAKSNSTGRWWLDKFSQPMFPGAILSGSSQEYMDRTVPNFGGDIGPSKTLNQFALDFR